MKRPPAAISLVSSSSSGAHIAAPILHSSLPSPFKHILESIGGGYREPNKMELSRGSEMKFAGSGEWGGAGAKRKLYWLRLVPDWEWSARRELWRRAKRKAESPPRE